jgi:radical SAM-linked protein
MEVFVLKARIKFKKYGASIFVGHLDLLRTMQRIINRSKLPIKYSEGFNKHQILSFAMPLSLGFYSDGELMDIELTEDVNLKELVSKLNDNTVNGIEFVSAESYENKKENSMNITAAAVYRMDTKEDLDISMIADMKEILVEKKTKKGMKEIDIKPLIYNLTKLENGTLELFCSAGSVDNLKPELILGVIFKENGKELEMNKIDVTRVTFYKKDEAGKLKEIL